MNKYDHRRAEAKAKVAFWVGTISVLVFVVCAISVLVMLPTYQALEPTKEDRCHNYLTFRHFEGYFEERTQHCVALTRTGSYILDDMYY